MRVLRWTPLRSRLPSGRGRPADERGLRVYSLGWLRTGTINLRLTLEDRMSDLRSCLNYTIDRKPRGDPIPPTIKEILDGRLFYHKVFFRATPPIIGKFDSLVSFAKDRRLS